MAALIDAIEIKRKSLFEFENIPFQCLEAVGNTPTARGGQTLVRLKMRNLLTNAVFEKSFKAGEKFKEPDLQSVPASYLYSDGDGSHFLDQESYETLTLSKTMVGDALDFLIEGAIVGGMLAAGSGRRHASPPARVAKSARGMGDAADVAGLAVKLLQNPIVRGYIVSALTGQLKKRFSV